MILLSIHQLFAGLWRPCSLTVQFPAWFWSQCFHLCGDKGQRSSSYMGHDPRIWWAHHLLGKLELSKVSFDSLPNKNEIWIHNYFILQRMDRKMNSWAKNKTKIFPNWVFHVDFFFIIKESKHNTIFTSKHSGIFGYINIALEIISIRYQYFLHH